MGRRHPVRTLVNYAVMAGAFWLAYRFFLGSESQRPADPFRSASKESPKHFRQHGGQNAEQIRDEKGNLGEGKEPVDDINKVRVDVGDLPKDLSGGNKSLASLASHEKLHLLGKIESDKQDRKVDYQNRKMMPFMAEEEDLQLEEEMMRRRETFFKNLKEREEELEENEYKNLHEDNDDITFVTASSHSTYHGTLQFIYSVQYFYPQSEVVIYDIGLKSEEKAFIESLCNTSVASLYLNLWPDHMYKIRHRIWRPLLIQFAVLRFGHCVYVEPGLYIYRQLIREYLEQSRVHGLVLGGKQMKHSTFFVTNAHMYTFLATDERRLMQTPHVELSIMVLHNTRRVAHYFLRYFMSCAMEEYCISPPGAQPNCDKYFVGRKYGRCHRYDESAINLILNKWHNYNPKEYFMKDHITMAYDGQDVSHKLKVCNSNNSTH